MILAIEKLFVFLREIKWTKGGDLCSVSYYHLLRAEAKLIKRERQCKYLDYCAIDLPNRETTGVKCLRVPLIFKIYFK